MNAARSAKKIATLAVMAALLTGGKAVLSSVANVEVVSLFCALFGYVFGLIAVVPVTIFVGIEVLIWGAWYPSWIIAYLIHFNAIVLVFWLLSFAKLKTPVVFVLVITLMTFVFGVMEAAFNVVVVSTDASDFFWRFGIYYGRGIAFYLTHIISNFVIFLLLFIPLRDITIGLKRKMML